MQNVLLCLLREGKRQQPPKLLRRLPHGKIAPEEKLRLAEFVQKRPDGLSVHKLYGTGKVEIQSF